MKEYKELRVEDPHHLVDALNEAARDGWRAVCALSVGIGYLLERKVSA